MKRIVLLIMALALTSAACNDQEHLQSETKYQTGNLVIAGQKLNIEIANTERLRAQGLSGRDSMPSDHGMLFVFKKQDKYVFWMKDMNFALDFVWIKEGQVVEITNNVQPQSAVPDDLLTRYTPKEEVDQVLEVNAGWAMQNQIKVGDSAVVDHL